MRTEQEAGSDERRDAPFGAPRQWQRIVLLALIAAPRDALCGLGWLARGKRVRGWNLLYIAAAAHPAYYRNWFTSIEGRVMRRLGTVRCDSERPTGIGCLLLGAGLGEDAACRTLRSVRASLGCATPVWTDVAALAGDGGVAHLDGARIETALSRIGAEVGWLLPVHAGDLTSVALGAVLDRLAPDPQASRAVYWDEDRWCGGRRDDPWIKPDWDPLLLGDGAGVIGAGLIAADALRAATTGWVDKFDVAGVANAVRRVLASDGPAPLHLPLILTHRGDSHHAGTARIPHASGASSTSIPAAPRAWPHVSIIIPTRDRADLLRSCLGSLRALAYLGKVSIVIVDNDSAEISTHVLLDRLRREGVAVLPFPGAFNFAAMINHAVGCVASEMTCLLNNDVEARDGAWLEAMVRHAVQRQVGAVGARLLYPDGTVQHAGVAAGIGGAAGHVQKGVRPQDHRFHQWHARSRTVSAVTAACMVLERAKFQAAGGMDAEAFPVDFNDVDLCLKLSASGLRNVLAVEATLVHHESQSRGDGRSPEEAVRFARELAMLRARWATKTRQDPYHSPLFRQEAERCILAF